MENNLNIELLKEEYRKLIDDDMAYNEEEYPNITSLLKEMDIDFSQFKKNTKVLEKLFSINEETEYNSLINTYLMGTLFEDKEVVKNEIFGAYSNEFIEALFPKEASICTFEELSRQHPELIDELVLNNSAINEFSEDIFKIVKSKNYMELLKTRFSDEKDVNHSYNYYKCSFNKVFSNIYNK